MFFPAHLVPQYNDPRYRRNKVNAPEAPEAPEAPPGPNENERVARLAELEAQTHIAQELLSQRIRQGQEEIDKLQTQRHTTYTEVEAIQARLAELQKINAAAEAHIHQLSQSAAERAQRIEVEMNAKIAAANEQVRIARETAEKAREEVKIEDVEEEEEKVAPNFNSFDSRQTFWKTDKRVSLDVIYGDLNPVDKGSSEQIRSIIGHAHWNKQFDTPAKVQCSTTWRLFLFQNIKDKLCNKLGLCEDSTLLPAFTEMFRFSENNSSTVTMHQFLSNIPQIDRIVALSKNIGAKKGHVKVFQRARVNIEGGDLMDVALLFSRCYCVGEQVERVAEFNLGVFLTALVAVDICPCFPLVMHMGMVRNIRNPRYAQTAEAFMLTEAADASLGDLKIDHTLDPYDVSTQINIIVRCIGLQLLYSVFCLHTYASVCHWSIDMKKIMYNKVELNNEMVFTFPGLRYANPPIDGRVVGCPYLIKLVGIDNFKPYSEDAMWFDYYRVMECVTTLATTHILSDHIIKKFETETNKCHQNSFQRGGDFPNSMPFSGLKKKETGTSETVFLDLWRVLSESLPAFHSKPEHTIHFTYRKMDSVLRKETQTIYRELMFKIDKTTKPLPFSVPLPPRVDPNAPFQSPHEPQPNQGRYAAPGFEPDPESVKETEKLNKQKRAKEQKEEAAKKQNTKQQPSPRSRSRSPPPPKEKHPQAKPRPQTAEEKKEPWPRPVPPPKPSSKSMDMWNNLPEEKKAAEAARILNVEPTAKKKTIERAFRAGSQLNHPDKSTDEDADDRQKVLGAAKEFLLEQLNKPHRRSWFNSF